jgi:hypothetical protein
VTFLNKSITTERRITGGIIDELAGGSQTKVLHGKERKRERRRSRAVLRKLARDKICWA